MINPRYRHTATYLENGKVLITGGVNTTSRLDSAEIYDPEKGKFVETGSMKAARDSHTATLLPNGKVLIAGGLGNSDALSSAELYIPE